LHNELERVERRRGDLRRLAVRADEACGAVGAEDAVDLLAQRLERVALVGSGAQQVVREPRGDARRASEAPE